MHTACVLPYLPRASLSPRPCQVEYAVKHEMAVTVKDMLSLRMRLAYINSEAAKEAVPACCTAHHHVTWLSPPR